MGVNKLTVRNVVVRPVPYLNGDGDESWWRLNDDGDDDDAALEEGEDGDA